MAWSDTGDFTSGQILTAAAMDKVREAMFFGQATFTNEAARDTAFNASGAMSPITLQEGMRAYLTAPTVPAATGDTTALPTGITTIYNGTAWVCTTAVGANTAATGTTTSATPSASLSGSPGTNPSVTLATGTTALVSLAAEMSSSGTSGVFAAVAVSGATTRAVVDAERISTGNAAGVISSTARTYVLTGLTAGTNTFTLQYWNGSGTGTIRYRTLMVLGIA